MREATTVKVMNDDIAEWECVVTLPIARNAVQSLAPTI